MNSVEENLQKYQLIQENIIYILSTSLIGINLKLSCYKFEGNNNPDIIYSSIFTIEQLKKADPIFQIANDCEDVQWIFEEVILAKSVGILENNGFLDVYFYMRVEGRKAKVILRLNGTLQKKMMIPPSNINNNINVNNNMNMIMNNNIKTNNNSINLNNINLNNSINMPNNINMNNNINVNGNMNMLNTMNMNNNMNINTYQQNQERLSKLQNDAAQLINEQNALRKQLSMFFGEDEDVKDNHERSRSTNQNNRYHNQLNNYNNFHNINNNVNNNNIVNLKRVNINDEDDDVYEVPPMDENIQ